MLGGPADRGQCRASKEGTSSPGRRRAPRSAHGSVQHRVSRRPRPPCRPHATPCYRRARPWMPMTIRSRARRRIGVVFRAAERSWHASIPRSQLWAYDHNCQGVRASHRPWTDALLTRKATEALKPLWPGVAYQKDRNPGADAAFGASPSSGGFCNTPSCTVHGPLVAGDSAGRRGRMKRLVRVWRSSQRRSTLPGARPQGMEQRPVRSFAQRPVPARLTARVAPPPRGGRNQMHLTCLKGASPGRGCRPSCHPRCARTSRPRCRRTRRKRTSRRSPPQAWEPRSETPG